MKCLYMIALMFLCVATSKEITTPQAPVPAAIKSGDLLQGRVDSKAKVYYLLSANSQDEVCLEYGAAIAKLYRAMKGKGAELILLSKESPASVLKWAKKVGLRCPVLPDSKRSAKLPFPYIGEHIPPYLVALDAEGRKLSEANHLHVLTLLSEWKQALAEQERKEKQQELPWGGGETDEEDELDWEDAPESPLEAEEAAP